MTSAILVQCSTNWSIKPSGRWPRCEVVIIYILVTIQVNMRTIINLNNGERYEDMIVHRSYELKNYANCGFGRLTGDLSKVGLKNIVTLGYLRRLYFARVV